jgi:ABC-type dipeptide/oligopeptide/nickel transport system ATPase subunit
LRQTTLARALIGLQSATEGQVQILGRDRAECARAVQFIFQDPLGSMSRRQSVGQTLEEPLLIHGVGDAMARRARVAELLDLVALPATVLDRLARSLSGGQRQRVSIARALAPRWLEISVGVPCLLVERRTWRGDDTLTIARQVFRGDAFDLTARFGPSS